VTPLKIYSYTRAMKGAAAHAQRAIARRRRSQPIVYRTTLFVVVRCTTELATDAAPRATTSSVCNRWCADHLSRADSNSSLALGLRPGLHRWWG